jgi:GTP cyclohydrolase I
MKLEKIIQKFEAKIPLELQESWDHSGLNLGNTDIDVSHVLFSYDICLEAIDEAVANGCQLIVSHHPFRMKADVAIDFNRRYEDRIIEKAIKNNVALYACHTNHDASELSLNRFYLNKLGLEQIKSLSPNLQDPTLGIGCHAIASKPIAVDDCLKQIKTLFKVQNIRFVRSKKSSFQKIGICTGSGASLIDHAIALDLDLFITGDVKYHQAIHAKRHDLAIADVGHFYSEIDSVNLLRDVFGYLFGDGLKLSIYDGLKDAFELF